MFDRKLHNRVLRIGRAYVSVTHIATRKTIWQLVVLSITLATLGIFNHRTHFVPNFDKANTGQDLGDHGFYTPRIQAEALKRGELNLRRTPFQPIHDLSWVGGRLQQIWGLGLPILMILADHVSLFSLRREFFPDRLLGLILVGVVLFVWVRNSLLFFKTDKTTGICILALTGLLFLHPTMLAIATSRFFIYEFVIYINVAWGLLLLGGVLSLFHKPTSMGRWLMVSAVAGYAPLIRPTSFVFSTAMFGLGALLVWTGSDRRWTRLVFGALVAAVPITFLLATNYVRFGHPLHFGFTTALTEIPADVYSLRFDYPFASLPLLSVLREMFGATFFKDNFSDWMESAYRTREITLPTFRLPDLFALLTALTVIAWSVIRGRSRCLDLSKTSGLGVYLSLSGVAAFSSLFYVLSRHSCLATRYVLDLYPAMIAILAGALLTLGHWREVSNSTIHFLSPSNLFALGSLVLFLVVQGWLVMESPTESTATYYSSARIKEVVEAERVLSTTPSAGVPKEYSCPITHAHNFYPGGHLGANLKAWHRLTDCSVTYATEAFLPVSRCVAATLKRGPASWRPLREQARPIRARAGNDKLSLESMTEIENGNLRLVFCRPEAFAPPVEEIVTFAWLPTEDLGKPIVEPIYLASLEAWPARD